MQPEMVISMRGLDRYINQLGLFLLTGMILFALLFPLSVSAAQQAGEQGAQRSAVAERLYQALPQFRAESPKGWLKAFYASRQFEPAWMSDNGDAEVVIARLNAAASEGLEPADYRISEIAVAVDLQRELLITDALLRYATHLQDGVYTPSSVDRKWFIRKTTTDQATALATALSSGTIDRFLDSLPPASAVYAGLRDQLQYHRELAEVGGWPVFPAQGPRKLEPGDRHAQIEHLRERLALTDGATTAEDPLVYDDALLESVKRFQLRHGLNDDGVIGKRTRAALAVSIDQRIRQIIAAMERWRWLPNDLGDPHIIVNVPAFRLWFNESGYEPLTMRTIVGTYKDQTPSFTNEMKYLVINPKWYVPNRIAAEELAPKVNHDPEYVNRSGFRVYDKLTGEEVDPSSVDWSQTGTGSEFPYRFVQSSGNRNALGNIKFMFPNRYGIYLHDTTTRHLFKKDYRAYSHGCVRLEKPMDLASRVLGESAPGDVGTMIRRAGKNKHVNLERPIPVYLVYMTAWAENGEAQFVDDLYRRDKTILSGKIKKR